MVIEIGDIVQHRATSLKGKVIGYGYRQVADSCYLTTLKVELRSYSSCPIQPIAEDLFDQWQVDRRIQTLACTLPRFPKGTLCEVA